MPWRAFFFLMLAAFTGWLCQSAPIVTGGMESGVKLDLPPAITGFISEKGEPDPVELKMLPEDTEFAKATYFTPTAEVGKKDVVQVSIVLSGAERRSIHRPEVCLQGQGWNLLNSRTLPVEMGGGRTLQVRDLYIEKPVTLRGGAKRSLRAHYFYWFVGTDVTTPSHTERIWLTLWDNIMRNVNHRWAYPSLMATVTENFSPEEIGQRPRSSEETVQLLEKMVQELAPQFQKSFMSSPPAVAKQ